LDPVEFPQRLSDPTRMNYAAVERDKLQMATTKARVEQIKRRQGERVVSLKRGESREVPPPRIELGHVV
jgi:hypothetical protein